jgi:DNA-binding GntR family transcriptional regulator
MILSGKLKKKQKLYYQKIVQDFNVSREVAQRIISQLNKDGLIISKRGVGSFIV